MLPFLSNGEWNAHSVPLGLPYLSVNTDLIFVQKVLLKDVSELSNYIDRSQLTAPLGGYLIYCHQSWVAFIKVILYLENVIPLSVALLLSASIESMSTTGKMKSQAAKASFLLKVWSSVNNHWQTGRYSTSNIIVVLESAQQYKNIRSG